jgi:hypothetical protein
MQEMSSFLQQGKGMGLVNNQNDPQVGLAIHIIQQLAAQAAAAGRR